MRTGLLIVALFATVSLAQALEDRGNSHTGLHPSAGGPSMANPGTRASDLSVAYDELDVSVPTGLGTFALKRKFSSAYGWSSMPVDNGAFGLSAVYSSASWFSSFSSYAVYRYTPANQIPGNVIPPTARMQVRDVEGDLTTSIDFGDLFANGTTFPADDSASTARLIRSGVISVTVGGGTYDVPKSIILVRPGEGRWQYEYVNANSAGVGLGHSAFYRLQRFFGPEWSVTPICDFAYNAVGQLQSVSLAGGVILWINWVAGHVSDVRIRASGENEHILVSYHYDQFSRLSEVVRTSGRTKYEYTDPQGDIFAVSTTGPDVTAGYRPVFSKRRTGPQLSCGGQGTWWGPPSVNDENTPMSEWTYSQTQACVSEPSTVVFQTQSNGDLLRYEYSTLRNPVHKALAGLTTRQTRSCTWTGGDCSDMPRTEAVWSLNDLVPQPVDKFSKDMRGSYALTDASENVVTTANGFDFRTTQIDSNVIGASNQNGATPGSLSTDYAWEYFDYKGTHEQLLHSETSASWIPGRTTTKTNRYDATSRQLRAQFTSGWTRNSKGDFEEKVVATFYHPTWLCDGKGKHDAYGRTMEIHGPCFVASTSSDDCDVFPADEQISITRLEYYDWIDPTFANAGRLKSKTNYHSTTGANCTLAGLITSFDVYDALGHVLQETSPTGLVTTRTYADELMLSETVGGLTRQFWYSADQGNRLSGTRSPAGTWEVYCYRQGASQSSCTGGTLATNLQWKARIDGDALAGNWVVLERTDYSYAPKPGNNGSGGGVLEKERTAFGGSVRATRYTYDALERVSSTSAVNDADVALFTSRRAYDAHDNVIGDAPPSANAPIYCGGLTPTGDPVTGYTTTSPLCTRPQFDLLERLTKVNSAGNRVTTFFGYGPSGSLDSVGDLGRGNLAKYETDDFGNVIRISGRWMTTGSIVAKQHDAAGNLRWKTGPNSAGPIEYRYDALNRSRSASFGGSTLWANGYDDNDPLLMSCRPSGKSWPGKLEWIDDSFGRSWYDYDALGNVTAIRRVRAGALPACPAAVSSTTANPDSTYQYDTEGRLVEMKYPHGLKVKYVWGKSGREGEVVEIQYDSLDGIGWRTLVDLINYDIGGTVASYRMGTAKAVNVNYYRNGPTPVPASSCGYDPGPGDGSGRLTAIRVARTGTNLLLRKYNWNAEQLTGQASCILAATTPTNEVYSYDDLQQLTRATRPTGEFATQGGPYSFLSYDYQFGTERTYEASGIDWWLSTYDPNGRTVGHRPRKDNTSTSDSSWLSQIYGYDDTGRVISLIETQMPGFNGLPAFNGRELGFDVNEGLGAVYRQVKVNGASYSYFYDSRGRRRLKQYPTKLADEFFYEGNHLLEDQGLVSAVKSSGHIFDQYIWLGDLPLAVVRQRFTAKDDRDTVSTDCTRNGIAATCGTYFIVNDYLPKPIAMVDAQGQLAGIGEYDAFGRVNTVSLRADAPAPRTEGNPFGPYQAYTGAIATFKVPLRGGALAMARVNYAAVNTSSVNHKTWLLKDSGKYPCSAGLPEVPLKYTGQLNAFSTPWFAIKDMDLQHCVWWDAGSQGGYGGVVTASYEYQLFESAVVTPTWIPLRFPGQYADVETGLFENWNRFYDPNRGQYLSTDQQVELQRMDSPFVGPYVYALNRPTLLVDRDGLTIQSNDNASGYEIAQLMRSGDPMIRMKMAQLVDDKTILVKVTNGWNPAVTLDGETKPGPRPGSTSYEGTQEIGAAGKQVSRDVYAVHWLHSEAVKAALSYGFVPSSATGLVGHELGHAWFLKYGVVGGINMNKSSSTDAEEALMWESSQRLQEGKPARPGNLGSEKPYFAAPGCARMLLGVCVQ